MCGRRKRANALVIWQLGIKVHGPCTSLRETQLQQRYIILDVPESLYLLSVMMFLQLQGTNTIEKSFDCIFNADTSALDLLIVVDPKLRSEPFVHFRVNAIATSVLKSHRIFLCVRGDN